MRVYNLNREWSREKMRERHRQTALERKREVETRAYLFFKYRLNSVYTYCHTSQLQRLSSSVLDRLFSLLCVRHSYNDISQWSFTRSVFARCGRLLSVLAAVLLCVHTTCVYVWFYVITFVFPSGTNWMSDISRGSSVVVLLRVYTVARSGVRFAF